MEQTRKSTISDVASEAGVSISTVSLVMNEKGYVSEDTRTRVMAAADRLGYVPTRAAQHLAGRRTGNVGFVLRENHFTRSEPFYTRIFLATEFEARLQGLYVLLTTIPDVYTHRLHAPRFLREGNVDGLLVAGKVDEAFLKEVQKLKLPTVLIDYEATGYACVAIDNQGGAKAAVEHLLARGHRRIAFAGADMDHPSLAERLAGYRLALAGAGLTVDPALILTDPDVPSRAAGLRLGARLLEADAPPTAVLCANDALALGVLEHARQRGIRVPEDLAVVGFDDVPGAVESVPPLTTVRVFKEQLGELALRRLTELIAPARGERPFARGISVVRVSGELVVRQST